MIFTEVYLVYYPKKDEISIFIEPTALLQLALLYFENLDQLINQLVHVPVEVVENIT